MLRLIMRVCLIIKKGIEKNFAKGKIAAVVTTAALA